MATKNFTNFNLSTSPLTGDYIVGYCQDGSTEIRTTVSNLGNTLKTLPGFGVYTTGGGLNSIIPVAGDNTASGAYSNVAGGCSNTASGNTSNVAGGCCNTASGCYSNVAGGSINTICSDAYGATISGGQSNNIGNFGSYATISGGYGNIVNGGGSAVLAGAYNCSTGSTYGNAVVAGGYFNCAIGNTSNVAGGCCNTASGCYSNVAGGKSNTASEYASNVAGGVVNTASGRYTTVAGGANNLNNGLYASIGGGCCNTASCFYSTVAGGASNTASANNSTVAGGCCNTACGAFSNVAGGRCNTASGDYSFVAGGYGNNTNNINNTFTLGSNLIASQANYTYVNNLSSQGSINTGSLTTGSSVTTFNNNSLTIVATASGSVYESLQNTVAGVSASTDISIYNDLGTIYLDMGINSSKYNGNIYSPKFNVVGPNDSYFYSTSANLGIGNAGTNGDLIFFTGGSLSGTSVNSGNERLRIKNTNASINGGFVGINTSNPNQQLTVVGNVSSTGIVATSALRVIDGVYPTTLTNTTMGSGTLVTNASATIATTAVTNNSRIFITIQNPIGSIGTPFVASRIATTSFTVSSTNINDRSGFAWLLVEPA